MKFEQSALQTQVFSSAAQLNQSAAQKSEAEKELHPDLGFDSDVARKSRRLLNRDGSFNVYRQGYNLWYSRSFYHYFVNASWPKFLFIVALVYFSLNLLFALAYFACGRNALAGAEGVTAVERLFDAFFFSVQTLATLGYGKISPHGLLPNFIATFEVLIGLLLFALGTGLCFTKFSRPTAKVSLSDFALITPYRGATAFQFRLVNERKSQLTDVQVRVVMSRLEFDGRTIKRKFYNLTLERDQAMFFPLHWTVVHQIDEASPLYGVTERQLAESDAEFLVMLSGVDETFSQTVHSRSSYKHDEVVWNAQFANILEEMPNGCLAVDLNRIHDIEYINTPNKTGK